MPPKKVLNNIYDKIKSESNCKSKMLQKLDKNMYTFADKAMQLASCKK